MKLDHDLVRNILIELEEHWPAGHAATIQEGDRGPSKEIVDRLNVDIDVLLEHLELLHQVGYLEGKLLSDLSGATGFFLKRVTWEGHQFTADIQDNAVWKKTKAKAAEISSSVSVSVLAEIARRVLLGA